MPPIYTVLSYFRETTTSPYSETCCDVFSSFSGDLGRTRDPRPNPTRPFGFRGELFVRTRASIYVYDNAYDHKSLYTFVTGVEDGN